MNSKQKYMIVNTTVRKPRICPNSGNDLRSAAEKKGYRVQWRDSRNTIKSVSPAEWGSNPVIVDELSDSLLNFVRDGLIEIKKIDDIGDVLKDFSTTAAKKTTEPAKGEAVKEEAAPKKRARRKAKASEMSKADPKELAAEKEDYPGAVNPDGPNNFTVTAKPKEKKPSVAVKSEAKLDGATHAG